MLLQELKAQAFKLSQNDRLALAIAIIESLQDSPISPSSFKGRDRSSAIRRMRGLLRTDHQAPTDEEVG